MHFTDIIGLIGVAISVYCYGRIQWKRDYAKTLAFSSLNFLSTLLLFISLLVNWNLAAVISNSIWCFFSLYGIYRCLKYRFIKGESGDI